MKRLIFLDIDGVLNGHDFIREAQSTGISRPCIEQFNRIVRVTGAKIILSSAWRYIVHGRAMTLRGFEYMLRTHGATGVVHGIIGLTAPDEHCPECGHRHTNRRGNQNRICGKTLDRLCIKCGSSSTRGRQISRWLADNVTGEKVRYVVIDDCDLGIRAAGHPLVQTHERRGLTRRKADEAIKILGRIKQERRAREALAGKDVT